MEVAVVKEEVKISTAKSTMTVKIIDTLMLMENLDAGKNCLAM